MKNHNKKIKQEYKLVKRPLGVFLIRNTTNDKVYLAAGTDIQGIINRHKFALSMGSHRSKDLQKDWNELGADKFEFEILDQTKPTDDAGFDARGELQVMEEMWLEKMEPYGERGYNERKLTREERIKKISENKP
ncbi:MAG TPA: GIY-YIG nuclease family protein [Pyrinomonadaceae bacterium]|nr:GIY-YIG nuclease family protein [Pyrinomonadaceae bacterium]